MALDAVSVRLHVKHPPSPTIQRGPTLDPPASSVADREALKDSASIRDVDDDVWWIPGILLNGWGGIAQLILIALGVYLLRQLLRTQVDTPIESTDDVDCEQEDGGAHHQRGKRWQRIPATGGSASEDAHTRKTCLRPQNLTPEPMIGVQECATASDPSS